MTDEQVSKKVSEFISTITDRPMVILFAVSSGVLTMGNCANQMGQRKYLLLKSFHAGLEQYGRQPPQQPGVARN
jgi:TRAP-type C4-dicarboxylate transport system permease large subunit